MPTLTEFGYCPKCEIEHVELVPLGGGQLLGCHKCGNPDIYKNRRAYEKSEKSQ